MFYLRYRYALVIDITLFSLFCWNNDISIYLYSKVIMLL